MALLITGPHGAGKTTAARVVAQRFERGVHVEGDAFLRFVVAGRETMTPNASPEAVAQLRLRSALSLQAAREYERAGFQVVVDDVVAGPLLAEMAEAYERLVVLFPDEDTIAEWLDNGRLTPERTATAILRA